MNFQAIFFFLVGRYLTYQVRFNTRLTWRV